MHSPVNVNYVFYQLRVSAHKSHHQAFYNILIGKGKCYYYMFTLIVRCNCKSFIILIMIKIYHFCDDGRGTKKKFREFMCKQIQHRLFFRILNKKKLHKPFP